MTYIRVAWIHQHADEPVVLYGELDAQRFEVRKIEVFRDGSIGYANAEESTHGTRLGWEPVPELDVIARDPEFSPGEITHEEFEVLWRDRAPGMSNALVLEEGA